MVKRVLILWKNVCEKLTRTRAQGGVSVGGVGTFEKEKKKILLGFRLCSGGLSAAVWWTVRRLWTQVFLQSGPKFTGLVGIPGEWWTIRRSFSAKRRVFGLLSLPLGVNGGQSGASWWTVRRLTFIGAQCCWNFVWVARKSMADSLGPRGGLSVAQISVSNG